MSPVLAQAGAALFEAMVAVGMVGAVASTITLPVDVNKALTVPAQLLALLLA